MGLAGGAVPHLGHLHQCAARSEACSLQRAPLALLLHRHPNLYSRFDFATGKQNRIPPRGVNYPQTPSRSSSAGQSCPLSVPFPQLLLSQANTSPVPPRKESFPMMERKKVNMSLLDLLPGPFPTGVMVGLMLWKIPERDPPAGLCSYPWTQTSCISKGQS